jgi:hypothetical protein
MSANETDSSRMSVCIPLLIPHVIGFRRILNNQESTVSTATNHHSTFNSLLTSLIKTLKQARKLIFMAYSVVQEKNKNRSFHFMFLANPPSSSSAYSLALRLSSLIAATMYILGVRYVMKDAPISKQHVAKRTSTSSAQNVCRLRKWYTSRPVAARKAMEVKIHTRALGPRQDSSCMHGDY